MAITQDWQFDLAGTTFGVGTSLANGSRIVVTEISGLDLPEVNATTSVRSASHGSFVTARYHKERVMVISGRINSSAANYAADTYTLKQLFQRRTSDVLFSFQLPGQGITYINVKSFGVRYAIRNVETAVGLIDFQATLVAGDPRIYSNTASSGTVAVGANANFTNAGIFPAPTTMVLAGPLTNPTITNTTTGDTIGFVITLAAGQSLTVSSIDQTVYNGSTSQYSTVSGTNKTFIELAAGVNNISLAASAGTGNLTVNYRSTWL